MKITPHYPANALVLQFCTLPTSQAAAVRAENHCTSAANVPAAARIKAKRRDCVGTTFMRMHQIAFCMQAPIFCSKLLILLAIIGMCCRNETIQTMNAALLSSFYNQLIFCLLGFVEMDIGRAIG